MYEWDLAEKKVDIYFSSFISFCFWTEVSQLPWTMENRD